MRIRSETFRAIRYLLAICLIIWASPVSAQLKDPGKLTVASYNVENFFDVFDDPYTDDEGTDVKPRGQIEAIAKAVAAMDADVVCFQELENEHVLQAMVTELLPDRGYEYVATVQGNDGRGITLGVASRLPIKSVTSHRWQTLTNPAAPGRSWRFARDLMKITLDLGDARELVVYNVHLKSNRDGPDDPNSSFFRTAEAIAVKVHVLKELEANPDALILVMGDFNSDYQRQPHDVRDWPAMAHLREPVNGQRVLIDMHDGLPRPQRITHPGDDRYPPVTFDYILASPALANRVVPGSTRVIDDTALTLGADHRPVIASFNINGL